ncbi:MAG: TolC family protein [Opitutales bacterium]|nr:TolC family protein [Opitutales bacterium]
MRHLTIVLLTLFSVFAAQSVVHATGPQPALPSALDLRTALSRALEFNPGIQAARERIEEQEGIRIELRAEILPQLSANARYSLFDRNLGDRGPGMPVADRDWSFGVQIRQMVYAGGAVFSALQAQDLRREASYYELQATIEEVLFEVRQRFYGVLLARAQLKVQEQTIELLERELVDARNRLEAGSSSRFEVLRAEVELDNAQPGLIRSRNRIDSALDALLQSIGLAEFGDRRPVQVQGEFDEPDIRLSLGEAIELAFDRRAEVKRSELLVESGDAMLSSQRRRQHPVVAAVGGYEWRKAFDSNRVGDSDGGWLVGLEMNWDLWDGHRTRARVQQAQSQLNQTRAAEVDLRLQIEFQVRQAYLNLVEARKLVSAASRVVERAEESLRLAQERQRSGAATQLDVLSAQVALSTARANAVQAEHDLTIARAAMAYAIGQ